MSATNVFWIRPRRHNVGNEAIAFALHELLRAQFGADVNLLPVAATRGEDDGWLAGISAEAVHEMNLYGHGVVIGGGNLLENGGLDVDIAALRELRPPLLLCGLSYGRIYDERGELQRRTDAMPDDTIRALGERAFATVVRDQATLVHLGDLGLGNVELGACPSLMLRPQSAPPPSGDRGEVLISIRNPRLMSVPLRDQARVAAEVRGLVEALRERGIGPVRLLCHDRRDMAFAAGFDDVAYAIPDDAADFLGRLRSAALVVSFRLHSFLPCMALGVPAVNISYDERSAGMMRTLGLGDWDLDFLSTPGLAAAAVERADRLEELEALRAANATRWAGLEDALRAALSRFGDAVTGYERASHAGRTQRATRTA